MLWKQQWYQWQTFHTELKVLWLVIRCMQRQWASWSWWRFCFWVWAKRADASHSPNQPVPDHPHCEDKHTLLSCKLRRRCQWHAWLFILGLRLWDLISAVPDGSWICSNLILSLFHCSITIKWLHDLQDHFHNNECYNHHYHCRHRHEYHHYHYCCAQEWYGHQNHHHDHYVNQHMCDC